MQSAKRAQEEESELGLYGEEGTWVISVCWLAFRDKIKSKI